MKNFFNTILIFYIILNISSASIAYNREVFFLVSLFYIAISISLYKTKYELKFVLLFITWLVINVFSFTYFSVSLPIFRIIIYSVSLLFLPYLLIKNLKDEFWMRFESIIYVLTIISLFLFPLNVMFNHIFDNLRSVFEVFTYPSRYSIKQYWSIFIYTNAYMDDFIGLFRNSGFMWEPGGFAMMLIWALCYHWLKSDKMKFDKRAIIYIIAILTTFSIAGYIALVVVIAAFFVKKISFYNVSLLILFLSISFYYYQRLEFFTNKMDVYIDSFEEDPTGRSGNINKKVNRFQGGVTAVLRTLEYPLGYGIMNAKERNDYLYSYGVNGLASILEMWGFFVFPVLLFLLRKCLILYGNNKSIIMINLMFIGLLVMFFSNPISRNIFFYLLIMTPLCYKKNKFITEELKLDVNLSSVENDINNK